MRISNNMMVYNFLTSLNSSQQQMNHIQEQLSDGKIVHRPSDDPIKAFRNLRFSTDLTMNEQYSQNLKDATSWMNQTDGALSDLSSLSQKAKELVVQASAPNPTESYQAIASEFDGLISQALTTANTQIGDRYIFAGQQDKVAGGPFVRQTINVAGVPTDFVVYKGDLNKISMPIQAGAPNPQKDSINVTGADVFGPLTTVTDSVTGISYQTADSFTDMLRTKEELQKPTPSTTYISTTALTNVDKGQDRVLLAQTQIGARMANYEMAQNMLDKANTTIAANSSANNDLDIAKATVDFKNFQNVYSAALAVGSRIMPPSLADYLK